jgi:hypothetical protein
MEGRDESWIRRVIPKSHFRTDGSAVIQFVSFNTCDNGQIKFARSNPRFATRSIRHGGGKLQMLRHATAVRNPGRLLSHMPDVDTLFTIG